MAVPAIRVQHSCAGGQSVVSVTDPTSDSRACLSQMEEMEEVRVPADVVACKD